MTKRRLGCFNRNLQPDLVDSYQARLELNENQRAVIDYVAKTSGFASTSEMTQNLMTLFR